MPFFAGLRAVLLKQEGVYGTDAAPVAATDALEVVNLKVKPLDIGYEKSAVVRPFFGNQKKRPHTKVMRASFGVQMAGFGTLGPATPTPAYAAALKICGLAQTVNAAVSVVYNLVSAGQASGTFWYYHNGRIHKMVGVRGNVKAVMKRNGIPMWMFELTGLEAPAIDGANVVPVLTAFQEPLTCTPGNTAFASLHGLATAAVESLEIDWGNRVVYRNLMNQAGGGESVQIVGREATGSVEIEDTTVAVKDWLSAIKTTALGALDVTHGTTNGNKVQFTGGGLQLTDPDFNDVDDIAHLKMAIDFQPTAAGNDELTITVK